VADPLCRDTVFTRSKAIVAFDFTKDFTKEGGISLTEIKLVDIDQIKVVDRVRKDMGNLEELAESIKELGLLQPILVTEELVLVAGERRLRACKMLGWDQIPARVERFEDHLARLKAERDENTTHKPFTFSEMVELARKLEAVEKERAKARSLANLKQYQESQDMVAGCQNFDTRETDITRTNSKVAQEIGFGSHETYRKAKFIAEHAPDVAPELIQQLDEGQIRIHRAYQELKAKLEAKLEEVMRRAGEAEKRAGELEKQLEEGHKVLSKMLLEREHLLQENEKLKREIEGLGNNPGDKSGPGSGEYESRLEGLAAQLKELEKQIEEKQFELSDLEYEIQKRKEKATAAEKASAVLYRRLEPLFEHKGVIEYELSKVTEDPYGSLARSIEKYLGVLESITDTLRGTLEKIRVR
jgi:ParB family chromosome partitioning protein